MSHSLYKYPQVAVPQAQRSIAGSDITSSYQLVGTVFGTGVVLIVLVSTLNGDVQISFDGTNDFMPVIAGAAIPLDLKSDGIALPGQLGVYVKSIGSTSTGNLYVSVIGT